MKKVKKQGAAERAARKAKVLAKRRAEVETEKKKKAEDDARNLILLFLCGIFLGFGVYAVYHFLNDRSSVVFGIYLNTWIKQYSVWCFTFICAAVSDWIVTKWIKPKAIKKYICISSVIVVMAMLRANNI